MKKNIKVLNMIPQVEWYNKEKDNLQDLTIKTRWNLKKNIKSFEKFTSPFFELKDSLQQELKIKYASDEKSIEVEVNGQFLRKVKEEYLPEYQSEVNDINSKLDQILNEQEQVEIYPINMDEQIQNMKPDAQLSDESMEMLSFYMEMQ